MSVTKWSQPLIDILVDNGILAEDFSTESIITTKPLTVVGGSLGRYNVVDPYTAPVVYPEGGRTVTLSPTLAAPFGAPESTTGNRFLGNGMPIESNFEVICRENLGVTEEKKWWSKELKAAVKEYGHDDVLEAFYNWSINQGTFLGKKPVTMFLKNIGSYIGITTCNWNIIQG